MELTPSAPDAVKSFRQQLLDGNVINDENSIYVFVQDYLFKSPSAAAAFVLGASANGWTEWKNKNGETLSDVYRETESESVSES